MSDAPLVSVVALFDRGEFEPCLSSLLAQSGVEFEVMAVTGDEDAKSHLPDDGRVRGIVIENRNPAYRRNAAATRARGKYLAFIDDDASAPADWLQKGVTFLEDFPIYAGVGGPNLCPEDSTPRELLTDLVLTTPVIGAGSRAYRGGGKAADAKPGEVHLVNFIVRRDWFDRVNGLNEALGYGGEDTELLYQMKKLGGRVRFDPELIVYHRRRAFGMPYFRQRFHLRRQSARLFVAYPGLYLRSLSFFGALLIVPVLIVAGIFSDPVYFAAVLAAAVFTAPPIAFLLGSSPFKKLRFHHWYGWKESLVWPFGLSFLLHWLVNLAGLWWGLAGAVLTGPWRLRKRVRRTMESCSI